MYTHIYIYQCICMYSIYICLYTDDFQVSNVFSICSYAVHAPDGISWYDLLVCALYGEITWTIWKQKPIVDTFPAPTQEG